MVRDAGDESLPHETRRSRDSYAVRPHKIVSDRVVYSLIMVDRDEDLSDDAAETTPRGAREAGDDFFCLRYHVWYPSFDCAIRTRFRTSEGCLRCDQGRFNLKRHSGALRGYRWRLASGD
jgi:hypothetical protein